MLNLNRISLLTKSYLTKRVYHHFTSKSKLFDLKNNSIALINNQEDKLPYMAEVELENQNKGVVLKIEDNGTTYLGMYNQVNTKDITSQYFTIKTIHKNWKQSSANLIKSIIQHPNKTYGIYDVNFNLIETLPQAPQTTNQQQQAYELLNGNKRRLKSSSPILNLSHDLYYGDMISFLGCRGSKKSQNSWNIAREFVLENKNQNIVIYVNPFINEAKEFTKICPNSISFTIPKSQRPTDTGVYMLALKAINISTQLKNKQRNVLLIIDNLTNIMVRQWSLLQAIKFNSKSINSSKLFQYNSLKIPPISILNEIYSNCDDNNKSSTPTSNLTKSSLIKQPHGSLTSILIAENQNNQLIQQITTFSNNIKHLQTLSKVIEFPLNFKINNNLYYKKPSSEDQFNQIKKEKGFQTKELHRFMRSYINRYMNEKKQTQLKRQLYKNDIKDAPWDYFFVLDAEWCVKGIKEMATVFSSFQQSTRFLRYITFNIQNDLMGHWSISAKQSYLKFTTYLKNQHGLPESTPLNQVDFTFEDLQAFVDDCRMQGLVSPFKKDYLI